MASYKIFLIESGKMMAQSLSPQSCPEFGYAQGVEPVAVTASQAVAQRQPLRVGMQGPYFTHHGRRLLRPQGRVQPSLRVAGPFGGSLSSHPHRKRSPTFHLETQRVYRALRQLGQVDPVSRRSQAHGESPNQRPRPAMARNS